jgi:hypothetical protein
MWWRMVIDIRFFFLLFVFFLPPFGLLLGTYSTHIFCTEISVFCKRNRLAVLV